MWLFCSRAGIPWHKTRMRVGEAGAAGRRNPAPGSRSAFRCGYGEPGRAASPCSLKSILSLVLLPFKSGQIGNMALLILPSCRPGHLLRASVSLCKHLPNCSERPGGGGGKAPRSGLGTREWHHYSRAPRTRISPWRAVVPPLNQVSPPPWTAGRPARCRLLGPALAPELQGLCQASGRTGPAQHLL